MSDKLILTTTIAYGEVDRDEVLTLSGVFKHLQEAAITHANQFDTGTKATAERGSRGFESHESSHQPVSKI